MCKYSFRITAIVLIALFFVSGSVLFDAAYQGGAYAETPADEAFTTEAFNVTIDLKEDNTMWVTEEISVDFVMPRHGLYRYIPYTGTATLMVDGEIQTHKADMKIENLQVTGHPYSVYQENGNYVIQIGSADVYVEGAQKYEISYQVLFYEDNTKAYDMFYWNTLPTDWPTPIETSHIIIHFPKEFDPSRAGFISGAYGVANEDAVAWTVEGSTVTGDLKNSLAFGEGVTFISMLPEGYFIGEMTTDWAFWAMLVLMIAAPLLSFILWYFFGRDPKVVKTVEFYPPEGTTSAEVGYIVNGAVDKKDILSMFMYFAEQGYLTIEERKKTNGKRLGEKTEFYLIKQKDLPDTAKTYELTLFNGIFSNKEEVSLSDLGDGFYDSYTASILQLKAHFSQKKENRIFTHSSIGARILGMLLMLVPTIAAFALGGIFILEPEFAVSGIPVIIILFIGYILIIQAYDNQYSYKASTRSIMQVIGVILGIVGISATGGWLLFAVGSVIGAVIAVAASVVSMLFTMLMKRRTKKSAMLLGKILGFREFIRSAELDRIQRLVEENPSYYYHVLPYAYVFGLTDKWAKNFEKIPLETAAMVPFFL